MRPRTAKSANAFWVAPLWGACVLAGTGASPVRAQDPELKQLVERITRGDEQDAAEATDRLIERVIGPVADALGSVESRPPEEQLRLRRALSRLAGALRIRLLRVDLSADDRRLFDEFAARYPALVEQLFDDDWPRRLAAVQQIPIEPGSGASVLAVVKVNDSDGDVAEAALEVCAALHDEIVVRGLSRYIQDATAALRREHLRPADQYVSIALVGFINRAIEILGQVRAKDAVPAINAAVAYLPRSPYAAIFDLRAAAVALAAMGDERAAPALLEYLPDRTILRSQNVGQDRRAAQTLGDAVLLSLFRIYRLDPAAFGMIVEPPPSFFGGYVEDKARELGHLAFRRWYEQNAGRPPEQRTQPASQPATSQPVEKS